MTGELHLIADDLGHDPAWTSGKPEPAGLPTWLDRAAARGVLDAQERLAVHDPLGRLDGEAGRDYSHGRGPRNPSTRTGERPPGRE